MNATLAASSTHATARWHELIALPPHRDAAEAFDAAIEALIRDFGAEVIWVFGSCARGCPTRHSDVDFLIIRSPKPDCPRPATAARLCLARLPYFLPHDIIVLTPTEWEQRCRRPTGVYQEVATAGIRVYAR
ncbi:MAG: nucleotidyltransferase domain-containing protein [Verrucomicrobiota bacterium]